LLGKKNPFISGENLSIGPRKKDRQGPTWGGKKGGGPKGLHCPKTRGKKKKFRPEQQKKGVALEKRKKLAQDFSKKKGALAVKEKEAISGEKKKGERETPEERKKLILWKRPLMPEKKRGGIKNELLRKLKKKKKKKGTVPQSKKKKRGEGEEK